MNFHQVTDTGIQNKQRDLCLEPDVVCLLDPSNRAKSLEELDYYSQIPPSEKVKEPKEHLWYSLYETCECEICKCLHPCRQKPVIKTWHSPSDLMQNKLAMKAPFTRKFIQATTHKAILDIGAAIEEEILYQHEKKKQEELAAQKKILTEEFQRSIMAQIKDVEAKERAVCSREIQKLSEEFEIQLGIKVKELQDRLEKEYQKFAMTHAEDLINAWQSKLNAAVEETTKKMTKVLLDDLNRQEAILHMFFKTELIKKEMWKEYEITKQQLEFQRHLQQEKHRMECKNISNMMYILCMERRKCFQEKDIIEEYYTFEASQLNNTVHMQENKINELKQEIKNRMRQVELRETCILEIIKQYQKLINFALKAAPTQAQFLLSIQKLMTFELKQKTKPPEMLPPCETILPWAKIPESMEVETVADLTLEDYHNCFDELAMPKREEDIQLPAFTYKEKLYVREDFRNLISQGIVLTPSHDLWSEDVEILVKILRESVSGSDVVEGEPEQSRTSLGNTPAENVQEEQEGSETIEKKKEHKSTSYLRFKFSQSSGDKRVKETQSKAVPEKKASSLAYKTAIKHAQEPSQPGEAIALIVSETNPTLLGVKSSVEIAMEKATVKPHKPQFDETAQLEKPTRILKDEKSTERVLGAGQSSSILKGLTPSSKVSIEKEEKLYTEVQMKIEVTTRNRTSFCTSLESDDVNAPDLNRRISSKLVTTRDSVAHLRQSRQELLKPAICDVCKKRETSKEIPQPVTIPKDYCCQRCMRMSRIKTTKTRTSGSISADITQARKASHETDSQLALVMQPVSSGEFYPEKLASLYKLPPQTKEKTKINNDTRKKRIDKYSTQTEEESVSSKGPFIFENPTSVSRMLSFINVMSDNPQLIKLFTACQR